MLSTSAFLTRDSGATSAHYLGKTMPKASQSAVLILDTDSPEGSLVWGMCQKLALFSCLLSSFGFWSCPGARLPEYNPQNHLKTGAKIPVVPWIPLETSMWSQWLMPPECCLACTEGLLSTVFPGVTLSLNDMVFILLCSSPSCWPKKKKNSNNSILSPITSFLRCCSPSG